MTLLLYWLTIGLAWSIVRLIEEDVVQQIRVDHMAISKLFSPLIAMMSMIVVLFFVLLVSSVIWPVSIYNTYE